jgi:hypothetical protein
MIECQVSIPGFSGNVDDDALKASHLWRRAPSCVMEFLDVSEWVVGVGFILFFRFHRSM